MKNFTKFARVISFTISLAYDMCVWRNAVLPLPAPKVLKPFLGQMPGSTRHFG